LPATKPIPTTQRVDEFAVLVDYSIYCTLCVCVCVCVCPVEYKTVIDDRVFTAAGRSSASIDRR